MSTPEDQTSTADERIGQLLNDYLDRRARGVAETEADFLAAHPDLANDLRDHLAFVDRLPSRRTTAERLIASGILSPPQADGYTARFGDYDIARVLGEGAAGIVLDAWDARLRRKVAIKILRPEYAQDNVAIARFEREARSAATFNHPNIVTVHNVGQMNGLPFLAMEFVPGPSLAHLIAEHGPLPAGLVRELFRQLLTGLAVAHQNGLVHRDIKPSNLLLTSDPIQSAARMDTSAAQDLPPSASGPTLKIADFGLARMVNAQTLVTQHAGTVLGTPHYMSPEQARGDGEIDHRTDLYSAGVVLYEMVTGKRPFANTHASAVTHAIVHQLPAPPDAILRTVDRDLAHLAMVFMSKQKQQRPPSALAGIAMVDTRATFIRRAARRMRGVRRRTLVLIAAAALVGMGAAATIHSLHITSVGKVGDLRLVARYNDLAITDRTIAAFPPEAAEIVGYCWGTIDHSQEQIVATMTRISYDNALLTCFDRWGRSKWKHRLCAPEVWTWPGCESVGECQGVAVELLDLDKPLGQVIAANTRDGTGCCGFNIALFDPSTGVRLANFWNYGQVGDEENKLGVAPLPGYFPDGRTALLCWGINNKLDGWEELPKGAQTAGRLTQFAKVPVMYILDPMNCDGIGPPGSPPSMVDGQECNLPLPEAHVEAMAMIDLAAGAARFEDDTGIERMPRYDETGQIHDIEFVGNLTQITVHVNRPLGNTFIDGAAYTIDLDLNLIEVRPDDSDPVQDDDFWRSRWKRTIIPSRSSGSN